MLISKKYHISAMDKGNSPVAQVDLPVMLSFETMDCLSGQSDRPEDSLETIDFDSVNPATGPVYLNDVHAGDVVRIEIKGILVKSPGKMLAVPGLGVLGRRVAQAESRLLDIEGGHVVFNENVSLPVKPMIGVIGVAPRDGAVNCGIPGDHGGNLDTTLIAPGATLYLPAFVDGALLVHGEPPRRNG